MSNDYFNHTSILGAFTLARASAVNAIHAAIAAGFELLPDKLPLHEGRVTYAADTGAADAYAVALTLAPVAYVEGLRITFKVANSNTTASTLDVNSLGVKAIKRWDGNDLEAGDLLINSIADVIYNGTEFRLVNPAGIVTIAAQAAASAAAASAAAALTSESNAATSESNAAASEIAAAASATDAANAGIDIGDIKWSARSSPGTGYLLCDGSTLDSVADTTKADLFTALGTTFGGTGAADFDLPDLRGRGPIGVGTSPDSGDGGGAGTARALADKAGKESDDVAAHDHGGTTGAESQTASSASGANVRPNNPHTHTISNQAAQTLNNVSPSLTLNAFIRFA